MTAKAPILNHLDRGSPLAQYLWKGREIGEQSSFPGAWLKGCPTAPSPHRPLHGMADGSSCAHPVGDPLPTSSNLYLTRSVVLSWTLHSTLKQKVRGTNSGYLGFFLPFPTSSLGISIRLVIEPLLQNNILPEISPTQKKFKGTLILRKFKFYELTWKAHHIVNHNNPPFIIPHHSQVKQTQFENPNKIPEVKIKCRTWQNCLTIVITRRSCLKYSFWGFTPRKLDPSAL